MPLDTVEDGRPARVLSGHLALVEVDVPEPGPGQVLISVVAAGVNRADLAQSRGQYDPPPGVPSWAGLGLECAGVVARVGAGVSGVDEGDAVCALVVAGACADFCVAQASCLMPLPLVGIDPSADPRWGPGFHPISDQEAVESLGDVAGAPVGDGGSRSSTHVGRAARPGPGARGAGTTGAEGVAGGPGGGGGVGDVDRANGTGGAGGPDGTSARGAGTTDAGGVAGGPDGGGGVGDLAGPDGTGGAGGPDEGGRVGDVAGPDGIGGTDGAGRSVDAHLEPALAGRADLAVAPAPLTAKGPVARDTWSRPERADTPDPAARLQLGRERAPFVLAATLVEAAATSWSALVDIAGVAVDPFVNSDRGTTVLVHGGTGSVGSTAIQLARTLGCRVLATAGSRERALTCVTLGAEAALDRHEDVAEFVRVQTGGRGVDVVVDVSGGGLLRANLASLARGGTLVVIGLLGGPHADLDLGLLLTRGLTIRGQTLRSLPQVRRSRLCDSLVTHVWPMVRRGRIRPVLAGAWSLEDAARAHDSVLHAPTIGSHVLIP